MTPFEGTAPIDCTPANQRVPDELNGEVYRGDVIVPPDLTDSDYAERTLTRRFVEAKHVERSMNKKFRCIQIHVHYPDVGEYIGHVPLEYIGSPWKFWLARAWGFLTGREVWS